MSNFTRISIMVAAALVLALGLARIDFSTGSGSSAPAGPLVAAYSDFGPGDVREESLIDVVPVADAIRFFEQRVEANPGSYIDLSHLAAQYLRSARDLGNAGHVDRAIDAAASSLEINPTYQVALVTYSTALAANHRFREALESAGRVPNSSRSQGNALAVAGDAHLALGDYDYAAQVYAQLHENSPGKACLSRLAHLAFLDGDTQSALAMARLAAEEALAFGVSRHDMAWHLSAIGEFLLSDGEAKQALDHFERALELAPDHIFALAGTAHAQWMSGDLASSAATYQRALALAPSDTGLMVELADVLRAQGRSGEAAPLVADAIAGLKGSLSSPELVRRELAQVLADNGIELELALRLAREEVEERPDLYAHDLLAWALYRAGEFGEARDHIEKALERGTRDAGIHYHAELIYSVLGDTERAGEARERVNEINPNFAVVLPAGIAQ